MNAKHNNQVQEIYLGNRIHIIGNSCAGKSSLSSQLATILEIPVVELDALNWEPGWVGLNSTNPKKLEERFQSATKGDQWIVAGSYMDFSQRIFWSRVETVIWLDLPLFQLIGRMLVRSWSRWRNHELLWGTNYEKFWPQMMVWRKEESLLWWIVTQHQRKRRSLLTYSMEARWKHIRFIRLCSSMEVKLFVGMIKS